jgi:signal peptidase I
MEPTIVQGDGIVVDTRYYGTHVPNREDVIVFRKEDLFVIKRVIGVSGDTIEGHDREILLNGSVLTESYIEHTQQLGSNPLLDSFSPITVPNGSYLVMGDNRDVSLDSRYPGYGLIGTRSIVGRPLYIYKSAADRTGKTVR